MTLPLVDGSPRYGEPSRADEAKAATEVAQFISSHSSLILPAFNEAIRDPLRRKHAQELVLGKVDNPTSYLAAAADLLYYSRFQREASAFGLRIPLYSTFDQFRINAKAPTSQPPTGRLLGDRRWWFLGRQIGFPIGVPASALTGSPGWISFLANSGYNVLTFKTVRSRPVSAFDAPNWVLLSDVTSPFQSDQLSSEPITVRGDAEAALPSDPSKISTANSFGVPSPKPEIWQEQVREAILDLHQTQMLIVSVMGDHYGTHRSEDLIADYVRVAEFAVAAGAEAVELNVSCPNTLDANRPGIRPPICANITLTAQIAHAVRAALGSDVSLLLKISYAPQQDLQDLVSSVGDAVNGYSAINTLQSRVLDKTGATLFKSQDRTKDRNLAGISGLAIRDLAADTVRNLAVIRAELGFDFDIVGMGGVTDPESFEHLYHAGASVVQAASGVFANAWLARDCFERHGEALSDTAESAPEAVQEAVRGSVLRYVMGLGDAGATVMEAGSRLPHPASHVYFALDRLESEGLVKAVSERGGYSVYKASR